MQGCRILEWAEELSDRFAPPYLRHEKPRRSADHVQRYRELEADIRKKLPELEALAQTSEPWARLVHHARLSAQLAHALALYAAEDPAVREAAATLTEMAYSLFDETYDYLDVMFYTVILGMVLDTSDFEFAREVETEL